MKPRKLNILVLFDGGGLSMRGLLDAGHDCTGVELMPEKAHLSKLLNPDAKAHIVKNVLDLDMEWIKSFDAVWASPPCVKRSDVNSHDTDTEEYAIYDTLLDWSLNLPNEILWVENVLSRYRYDNDFGQFWNAAQFEENPRQQRRRIIAGRYKSPYSYRPYQASYPNLDICPAIMASGRSSGFRPKFDRSQGWYGRKLSISEAAYHQGLEIPHRLLHSWWYPMPGYTQAQWRVNMYEAIGNGVPVYMSRAFGEAYSKPKEPIIFRQLELFAEAA
jgi:site-specific DNA-cytosine methylase